MNRPAAKTIFLINESNMSSKIKFLARFLVLAVFALFTNCEKNEDIIDESALEHHTPPVLSEKISFTQSKHFSEINSEIKSIQTKFNKRQTSKENQSETGSLKILTDEVLYVTYAGTHTYTFKVVRENPIYILENIVLHYNLHTKSYDEYLIQYKDLKEQDIKEIFEGKLFQDSKKVIVTKLEDGFFESHSSSNKGSSTSKASNFICNTVTSTLVVTCSQGVHNAGNMGEWHNCTATVKPYAYQSSYTTCVPTSSPTQVQETAEPSSGGGGNDPDVVIYNPLPLEPCDNNPDVDLNGNCIQPIDVAVSYIANRLSSSYSTTLSQNEINYLYSTTSSFEIQSYLQNNSSSESNAFAKEMINQMRQNPALILDITASSKSPSNIDRSTITNATTEGAKFNTVYDALTNSPEFKLLFIDLFQDNSRFNVKFEIGNVLNGANGNTNTDLNNPTLNTITISPAFLNSSNKMEIAKTIIHECIHAYLNIKLCDAGQGISIPTLNNLDYYNVVNQKYNGFNGSQDQHNFIYNYMLPIMGTILSEVKDSIVTPTNNLVMLSDIVVHIPYNNSPATPFIWNDYYHNLSLNGLQNCSFFQNEIGTIQVVNGVPIPIITINQTLMQSFIQYISRGHWNINN